MAFKKIIFWIILLFIGITLYSLWETHTPVLEEVTVAIEDLPSGLEGFTILQVTDLHSSFFGKDQKKLISLLKGKNYDLVALTGDILDLKNPDPNPGLILVKRLNRVKPVIFVPGNDERSNDYYPQFESDLEQLGVKVIADPGYFSMTKNGAALSILGLKYPYNHSESLELGRMAKSLPGPKILLTHAPDIFPEAVREQIDLVLVGHTHGGQICVPFRGALFAPSEGWFPHYTAGLFTEGKTNMYISRGLGTSIIPLRFLCPPEVSLITLKRKQ